MLKKLGLAAAVAASMLGGAGVTQAQETEVRLGWCNPSIDVSAGAPFAAAMEFGWFKEKNISVTLIPLAGSTDCVLNVTTGQVKAAFAAPEAVSIMASKGGEVQYYYTGFNRNMFGIAVPETSEVQDYAGLKGKRIGVLSMSSVGVVVARSVIQAAGLNPDADVAIVVAGSPVQSKTLLENGQIAALSQWDMVYEIIGANGLKLRKLKDPAIDNFPSNGFVALKSTIADEGDLLAAVARGYAMGSIYTRDHPEKAAELHFKHFPASRSTGLSLEDDVKRAQPTLAAVSRLWALPEGSTKWGYNNPAQYQSYIEWLKSRNVLASEVTGEQIVDNSLIDRINDFDEKAVSAAQ